jgi:putative dimethyl sulfoxide reductase chaperone
MDPSILAALRILSHFWLEEIRPTDLATIAALPGLAGTLPQTGEAALTDLAVEYQRLFGFNLPPYESIFIDPSAMLQAPATARVQALYREAGWTPPAQVRVGAPDHVGLELLALADLEAKAKAEAKEELEGLAYRLQTQHLVLWVPAFVLALRRLEPHSFYTALSNLTLDLLLTTLPPTSQLPIDPFPSLPPPPVYDHEGRLIPLAERQPETGLRAIIKHLLIPCEAGLFLTREEIGRMSRQLDLPTVMGERAYMLETLFRLAGQYDLVPALLDQLRQLLAQTDAAYQGWAAEYPAWTPYANAWRRRIATTHVTLSASEEFQEDDDS